MALLGPAASALTRRSLLRIAGSTLLAGVPKALVAATPAVRFATISNEQVATTFFADGLGFFRKAGVDVDLTLLTNGASVLAAVAGGAADIGVSNPLSLAAAHQRGIPLVAFAATSYYTTKTPTSLLLVAKDSPIRSGKDINGKTIGVGDLRAVPQLATEVWVDKTGGNSKTVNFIEMHYPEMAPGINSGRIDAAFCSEPALSKALATTRVLADALAAIGPEYPFGACITTLTYAQEHPDVLRRLRTALGDAAAWGNAHPDESAQIISHVTKIDIGVVKRMRRSYYAAELNAKELQLPIDMAARYGFLSVAFPADQLVWSGK